MGCLAVVGLLAASGCSESSGDDGDAVGGEADASVSYCVESGAAGADAGGRTPLVDHEAWSRTEPTNDPLAEHRPETVDCKESAIERRPLQGEPSISVHTKFCNYASVTQELDCAVREGESLYLRLFRSRLDFPEGEDVEAHVALLLDGSVVWEDTVAIPNDRSNLYTETWTAKRRYPEGTSVTYHVHNHGSNTWSLIDFTTAP